MGINGKLLSWLEQFLLDRAMRVQVNGSFSDWFRVLSGVPQGSVSGPLLFIIYVQDLPLWVANSIMMFADDTKLWTRISKLEDSESLQQDLWKLAEWSKKWLLAFNINIYYFLTAKGWIKSTCTRKHIKEIHTDMSNTANVIDS